MSTESRTQTDGQTEGTGETILEVQDLVKRFGGLTAVDHLSFEVFEQEILGFIGPNGAGKSTTFNAIFGTYAPTDGTVWLKGEDVTGFPPYKMVRRGLARTYQTFRPLPDRDVVSNVELSNATDKLLTLDGLLGKTMEDSIEVCERVGLGDDLYKMPDELPHAGMIRLELARAIATDPDILLIDEPFAGLSRHEVEQISELLLELREEGVTLIVVDHNMRGLLNLIDRAMVIHFGEVIAKGTPEEIKNDQRVQDAYLGSEEV